MASKITDYSPVPRLSCMGGGVHGTHTVCAWYTHSLCMLSSPRIYGKKRGFGNLVIETIIIITYFLNLKLSLELN